MLSTSVLYLSDVPEFIALVPGTKMRDVAPSTQKKYKDCIARFIEFMGEDVPVETIDRETYAAFHEWLGTRGTRAITCNGYRRRQRAIWNRLRERGIDVCDNRGIFKEQLEPAQKSKATMYGHMQSMLQLSNVRDTAVILYTASAGFRRQTIPRLRVDNTRIWLSDSGQYRIASKIPQEKTSPPRLIIGDEAAALAVKLWLEIREFQDSPWLFYEMHNGDQMSEFNVSDIFGRLRRAANIPAWSNASAHGLRHRFAQEQLNEHDQKIVAQWMGISVETMLKVYAHRDEESLITARLGDKDFPKELLNGNGKS